MAGAAGAVWAWHGYQPIAPLAPAPLTTPVAPATQPLQASSHVSPKQPATDAGSTTTARVYWLREQAHHLQLVPDHTGSQSLANRLHQLLQGPNTAADISTIPAGTQLLSLQVRPDGIHVDLSHQFTAGGGSTAMIGRLGQVLYTATSLNPQAPVWLSVEGKPLKLLGGEGLMVSQPLTRTQFKHDFQL